MARITTSLVIPAYNEEKYIGRLLDSILQQTVIPHEIIVVDNASTDHTADIVRSYQSRLPLKLYFQPDKGITPTVIMGFSHAHGDIILKTDADCILPPSWVARHLQHYVADPTLVACGGFFLENHTRHLSLPLIVMVFPILTLITIAKYGHPQLYGGNLSIRRLTYLHINGYTPSPDYCAVDDLRLSQKLFHHQLHFANFSDCYCFTSFRRFRHPSAIVRGLLATTDDKFYREKST